MNWLNLNVTVLDSEEFLGAEPVERATWLCLLRYCIGQENGGRIQGAADWKDRKWQQVVRVTSEEVGASCDLWKWDGDDLVVAFYPEDKEAEVRHLRSIGKQTSDAKRAASKANGSKGGRPTINPQEPNVNPTINPQEPNVNPTINPQEPNVNPTINPRKTHRKEVERKGREIEIEREREDAHALGFSAPPNPEQTGDDWEDSMPTETARDFQALQSWINSLLPPWAKRPAFTFLEMQDLKANSRILFDLTDPDKALLKAYMNRDIPEDWGKFYKTFSRSKFIQTITDVLTAADRWKQACKKHNVATGLEGGVQ